MLAGGGTPRDAALDLLLPRLPLLRIDSIWSRGAPTIVPNRSRPATTTLLVTGWVVVGGLLAAGLLVALT